MVVVVLGMIYNTNWGGCLQKKLADVLVPEDTYSFNLYYKLANLQRQISLKLYR